jgi:hypothetical protein
MNISDHSQYTKEAHCHCTLKRIQKMKRFAIKKDKLREMYTCLFMARNNRVFKDTKNPMNTAVKRYAKGSFSKVSWSKKRESLTGLMMPAEEVIKKK